MEAENPTIIGVLDVVDIQGVIEKPVVVVEESTTSNETPTHTVDLSEAMKTALLNGLALAVTKQVKGPLSAVRVKNGFNSTTGYSKQGEHMRLIEQAGLKGTKPTADALFNAIGNHAIHAFNMNGMPMVGLTVSSTGFEQVMIESRGIKQVALALIAFDKLQRFAKAGITVKNLQVTTVENTMALDSIKATATLKAFGLEDPNAYVRTVEVDSASMVRQDFDALRLATFEGDYEPLDSYYQHGVRVYTYGQLKGQSVNEDIGFHHLSVNADTIGSLKVTARNFSCAIKTGGCGAKPVSVGQMAKNGNKCPTCNRPRHEMTGGSHQINLPQLMSNGNLKTYGGHQIHMVSCRINNALANAIKGVKNGTHTPQLAINMMMTYGVKVRSSVHGGNFVQASCYPVAFDVAHQGMTFGLAVERIEALEQPLD
tara:strand:+ start:1093 stop:2373 length:1281 start_codon:yes stop_codon:yes gene_type:complete